MKTLRRHLSYANIVATLALIFAMSGGALAAKHYLVNSTKQINPKVIKKLKGNAGAKGSAGPQGVQGPQGSVGQSGVKGADGVSALTHIVVRTREKSVESVELKVNCEPNEIAIGGGASFSDGSGGGGATISQSAPANRETAKIVAGGETPTAWAIGFDSPKFEPVTFYAICAST